MTKGTELSVREPGIGEPGQEPPGSKPCIPELTEAGSDINRVLDPVEKSYLEKAMELSEGNKSKAARLLNVKHPALK